MKNSYHATFVCRRPALKTSFIERFVVIAIVILKTAGSDLAVVRYVDASGASPTPPGSSYRFNWFLEDNYWNLGLAEDPDYNLAGKKESWPQEPSRFIMMHETSTFPWEDGATAYVYQWHYSAYPGKLFDVRTLKTDRDKPVAPILFVDGHSQPCDFTTMFQKNPMRALEPGKEWIWYKPLK